MGLYSTSQFSAPSAAVRWVAGCTARRGGRVFILCAGVAVAWLVMAIGMRPPRYLSNYMVNVGTVDEAKARELATRLAQVRGVAEATVIAADGVAYLKVDLHTLDSEALREFSSSAA